MVAPARSLASQVRLLKPSIPYLVPAPPPVDFTVSEAVQRLRDGFEARIASKLSSGTELLRAINRRRREEVLPTSLDGVDALLDGGIPRGKMIEIAGRGARFSIVIATLASATSIGEAAALVDLGDGFDPQLGHAAGIDLRRLLWIRPNTMKQAVAAAEMISQTGFQLVVIDAPAKSRRYVPAAAWVRLARAAEAHGNALMISAPYALTGTTSEAALTAQRTRARWRGGLLIGIETTVVLEKHRRKRPGESTQVAFACAEHLSANG